MGLLCIDIGSQFGAFNKSFSNTGGLLTYMVPPKTAIIGLFGCIVGYGLQETLKAFGNIRIGIEPLNNIETKTITYNCHYGGRPGRMVNIKQEILIEPKYRLYMEIEPKFKDKKLLDDINKLLQKSGVSEKAKDIRGGLELLFRNHISYYSLYMGKNDFPLRYSLRDVRTNELLSPDTENYLPTNCVVPRNAISNFKITAVEEKFERLKIKRSKPFSFFILSNVPTSQNPDREFTGFKDFLLKDKSRETVMEVIPNRKNNYSFYTDEGENLIVCF